METIQIDTWLQAKPTLYQRLCDEFTLSPQIAEQCVELIATMPDALRPAFKMWWETGWVNESLEVEVYTIRSLMMENPNIDTFLRTPVSDVAR